MVNRLFRGHYLAAFAVMAIAGLSALAIFLHAPKGFAANPTISVNFQETVPGSDTAAHTFTVQPKAGNTTNSGVSSGSTTVKGTKSGSNVIYKGTINNVKVQTGGRECGNGGCQYQYQVCDTTSNTCSGYWSGAQAPGRVTFTAAAAGGTAGNGNGNGGGGGNNNANASSTSCGSGSFDWIICPADYLFQKLAQNLMDFMQSLLYINTSNDTGIFGQNPNGNAYYRAWNTFRVLGTALIVIAGLVMVSAQAFGFEFLDAYTIRKVLPRLFVAIVGMSLSWPLLNFIVNFFNTVGQDVQQLMYAPFSTLPNHAQLADGIISWGFFAVIGGLLAAGLGTVIFPILMTGALALLIAILVLIVRQIGVTLLVIMAPFAIAAYVLPNTKKVWDIWKDNFLGLMFMYPIIMMLIAAGEIFGAVGKSGSFAQQIVGIVAFFIPYFMIPLAFRMATGFISQISGMVNDRSKGAFDRLRNARGNMTKKRTEALRGYNRFKGGTEHNLRGKANKFLGRAGNINQAGLHPGRMRDNMKQFESRHHNAEAAEFREKNAAFGMISGNEDYVYAALESKGNEKVLYNLLRGKYGYDEQTTRQAMAQIRNARGGTSDETFERASVLALAASGTGLKNRKVAKTNADGMMVDSAGNVVSRAEDAEQVAVRGGAGELNEYINKVWGDDRIGAASGAVAARGLAGQARRFDISGNSTGAALGMLEAQYNLDKATAKGVAPGSNATIQVVDAKGDPVKDAAGNPLMTYATSNNITDTTVRAALEGQGGSYVAGARKAAVEAFAPQMFTKLQETANSGNGKDFFRELAVVAGRYDAMSSVSPENARVLANNVLDQKLAGSNQTVQELIDANRDNPDFLKMRREYGASSRQGAVQAAQAGQAAQNAGQVQQPPVAPINPGP